MPGSDGDEATDDDNEICLYQSCKEEGKNQAEEHEEQEGGRKGREEEQDWLVRFVIACSG